MGKKSELHQTLVQIRRSKVLEELAKGLKIREVSTALSISETTVRRDIGFMQKESKENIRHFVEDRLIFEFDKALATLDIINRKTWELSTKSGTRRESLEAFSLIRDISKDRLEILTHGEMLRQCLKVSESNNRKLNRLEAKYKNKANKSTNGTAISGHGNSSIEREEIKRNESNQETEQTTNKDTSNSDATTHEIGESNGP